MNCGPYCIMALEAMHDRFLPIKEARKLCRTTTGGSYASDMVSALHTLGYKHARISENLTWRKLTNLTRKNHVLVAWWTPFEHGQVVDPSRWDGHWCIVRRITTKTITLIDPDADIDTVLTKDQFDILWHDYEIFEDGYKRAFHHAAVVARQEP